MLEIYTDGALRISNKQGGIAFLILQNNIVIYEHSKAFKNTTNNRMEMLACILALECIKTPSDILIISDSQYVVNSYNENWNRNVNLDLWERFDNAIKFHKTVKFKWVKGHDLNKYNNKCDLLAVAASRK